MYLTRYVCTTCGFTENYIDSPSDREKIQRKFGTLEDSDDGFV